MTGIGLPIVTSDSLLLPKATKALYVGVTGDVKVDFCFGKTAGAIGKVSGGSLVSILVDHGGFGYQSAPTVTIIGDGTGATATATIANGAVTGYTVTSPGTGYTSSSKLTIMLTGGLTGGTVIKALAAGIVHDLQVTKVYATGTTATNILGFF